MPSRIKWNPAQGQREGLTFDDRGRLRLRNMASGRENGGEYVSPVYGLGSRKAITVRWIEQWTAPQRWNKHPDNPVYGPHLSGAWDSWTNGVSIVAVAGQQKYRMYYAGRGGEGVGFAEAPIDSPCAWKEHPASPVLTPRTDNWEGNWINQPRVTTVSEDHWRMYYTGWGFPGPGTPWALGLAESFDGGITWRRHGEEPILARGDPSSFDGGGACVPMVLRADHRWMMWYTAAQVRPKGHVRIHLCLATSDDGLHWEKHAANPVLAGDSGFGVEASVTSRCYVRHDRGVFRMWYSYARPHYRIQYAESLDGVHWERSRIEPVLGPSEEPAWDDQMVEYPEVQVFNGIFRLWFCGNGYGSVGYAEGVCDAGVVLQVRSGNTARPDSSWSDWAGAAWGLPMYSDRFLQFRARLRSHNALINPTLNQAWIEASG